jgi:hypothetical protein
MNLAATIVREWEHFALQTGDSAAYDSDCRIIATTLLNECFAELNNHSLRDLNPELTRDHMQVHELADYLGSGIGFPMKKTRRFPDRLVPAAAQIAVRRATLFAASQPVSLNATYQAIHKRGLLYIQSESRSFLDSYFDLFALSTKRSDYLHHLTANLSFRHPT